MSIKTPTLQNVRRCIVDIHPYVVRGRIDGREFNIHLQAVRTAICIDLKRPPTSQYQDIPGTKQLGKEGTVAFAAMREWARGSLSLAGSSPAIA